MQDRLPAPGKANRIKITLDDGSAIEGVLSYADEAIQQGSAYNKANVLPDDVCNALGIATTSEPKDAFLGLKTYTEEAIGMVVKKVQRGMIRIANDETTATATISAVNPDKSLVIFGGSRLYPFTAGLSNIYWDVTLELVDSITVRATRTGSPKEYEAIVAWQVIEFS